MQDLNFGVKLGFFAEICGFFETNSKFAEISYCNLDFRGFTSILSYSSESYGYLEGFC